MAPPDATSVIDPADLLARLEKAESELQDVRQQLEHSHRLAMLGTLGAGIAHEINNLLTPVVAYAHMAQANIDDEELVRKALTKTLKAVGQAARVSESMLALALPSPPSAPKPRANILEACRAAIECLGRDPARDGINCRMIIPEHLECAMQPLALQQVLLNLILNAVRVLRSSMRRELEIEASVNPRGRIVITVRDSGPGIPREVFAELFTPFASSWHGRTLPRKGRQGGAGLGLSISKTLIEAAGGEITASTEQGKGTTFTITLDEAALEHKKAG